MTRDLPQLVRDTFSDQWWYSPQMPIEEMLLRARARLRHDHDEKCSVVVENLRQARAEQSKLLDPTPLTVPEARAILMADEALCLSYGLRVDTGTTFGIEEREAWTKLVASAEKRLEEYAHEVLHGKDGP